jgi:ribitol-5-phosphate 2-dehydrogenase (NADP+) / D-ribitol-5-phosphate cytidylyltransferase
MISAIILSGGVGVRFGNQIPKQFIKLAGKPVLIHTVEAFLANRQIEQVVVVCPRDFLDQTKILLEEHGLPSGRIRLAKGGAIRQVSSYNGLLACDSSTEYVLIHDAVRPLIDQATIDRVIRAVKEYNAVDTCIPSADTIVVREGDHIDHIPDRSKLLRGQTPQAFDYRLVLQAHEWARSMQYSHYTDDCGIVLDLGREIHIVPGDSRNVKITHIDDIYVAERLFQIGINSTTIGNTKAWCDGKSVLVIGGTGGLGREIANDLREEGAGVVTASRKSAHHVDMTDEKSVVAFFEDIAARQEKFNAVIYCAGVLIRKKLQDLSVAEWDDIYNTNLRGAFLAIKNLSKVLNRGGRFLAIGSSSYSLGRANYGAYSSSKSGLINLVQAAAAECPEYYINVVSPQRAKTPLRANNFSEASDLKGLLDAKAVSREVVSILSQNVSGLNFDIRVDLGMADNG